MKISTKTLEMNNKALNKLRWRKANQEVSDKSGCTLLVESLNIKINKLQPEPKQAKMSQMSYCQEICFGWQGHPRKCCKKTESVLSVKVEQSTKFVAKSINIYLSNLVSFCQKKKKN